MQAPVPLEVTSGGNASEVKENYLFFEGLVFTRILTESDGYAGGTLAPTRTCTADYVSCCLYVLDALALDTAAKNAARARGPMLPFAHTIYTITIDSTMDSTTPPTLNTAHIHFVVTGDTDRAAPSTEYPEEGSLSLDIFFI